MKGEEKKEKKQKRKKEEAWIRLALISFFSAQVPLSYNRTRRSTVIINNKQNNINNLLTLGSTHER